MTTTTGKPLNERSATITQGRDRAAARAMFKAIGLTDEDLAQAAGRHRQHLDRDDAVQLQPARARRSREGRDSRRRRHAARVQHDRDQRRDLDGHRGDEGLAGQPRGDRRLDRARRARLSVRRGRRAGRLRQDDSRRGDGAFAARHPRPGPLRRLDRTRQVRRPRPDDRRRVRSDRRCTPPGRSTTRAACDRELCLPGRRRVRRPVHRQHDGDGDRVPRALARRKRESRRDGSAQGRRRATAPASW